MKRFATEIKCARCGWVYHENTNQMAVYEFVTQDGLYRACTKCMMKLGHPSLTEAQKKELIEQFRVDDYEVQ